MPICPFFKEECTADLKCMFYLGGHKANEKCIIIVGLSNLSNLDKLNSIETNTGDTVSKLDDLINNS